MTSDTDTNNTATAKKKSVDIDSIFKQIGQFGLYQKWIYFLLCIPMFCNGFFAFSYVFTTNRAVHRCFVPGCDNENTSFVEPWVNFTIPSRDNSLSDCSQFVSVDNATTVWNGSNIEEGRGTCKEAFFSTSIERECDRFVFRDDDITIAKEFEIFCADEWKLSLVGSINSLAQFVGIPLGGYISDKYGRKAIIGLSGSISAIMGITRSFAFNYPTFLLFEFLDAIAGNSLFGAVFLMGIELAGPRNRVLVCSLLSCLYPVGEIALAMVAKHSANWRILLRLLYIPALIHMLYFWILPESIRWRLSKNQREEVNSALRKAAKLNRKSLRERDLVKLHEESCLTSDQQDSSSKESAIPLSHVFRVFCWKIVTCSFCWFANALVYFGLSLNSVLLNGDKYNNFITLAIAEIPGYILPYFIIDRYGRRYCLCASMLVCGLSIAVTLFLDKGNHNLVLALFLLGKFSITCAFQVLLFYTAEIFPTKVRHSMLSFCSMFARVGSMMAPQTTLLAKYFTLGPPIIFSVVSLIAGIMCLSFSETANTPLPSSLDHVESSKTTSKSHPETCKL